MFNVIEEPRIGDGMPRQGLQYWKVNCVELRRVVHIGVLSRCEEDASIHQGW